MSRFAQVLRRVDREVSIAEPVRSETLLELGADLEGAYQSYRARGLSEQEAVQRALLVGLSVFAIAGGMYAVVASDVLRDPPAGIWLIGVLTAAMAWTAMSGWLHASVGKSIADRILSSRRGSAGVTARSCRRRAVLGAFAAAVGLFGTLGGLAQLARVVEHTATVPSSLIWGGVGVTLVTTIFGLAVLLVALILWYVLRSRGDTAA